MSRQQATQASTTSRPKKSNIVSHKISFVALFRCPESFTTLDIVSIIDNLHSKFGEGYTFVPVYRVEGCIELTHWPGMPTTTDDNNAGRIDDHVPSKTIRFDRVENWPDIGDPSTQTDLWRNSEPIELTFKPREQFTDRKNKKLGGAFGFWAKSLNAPAWSRNEIKLIRESMEEAGLQLYKNKKSL